MADVASSHHGANPAAPVYSDITVNAISGAATRIRRISWGAVFAGFVVAVAIEFVLGLLGLAIGLTSIEPATEGVPSAVAFGTGAVIWWIISALIALFLGGAVAGHLAGVPIQMDSAIHGVLAWCMMALLTLFLMTSAAGRLASATGSALAYGLRSIGHGAGAILPDNIDVTGAYDAAAQLAPSQVFTQRQADNIRQEFRDILRQTGKTALQPDRLDQSTEELRETAAAATQRAVRHPSQTDEAAENVLNKFLQELADVRRAVDRDAVANVIAARTEMSPQESREVVDRWVRAAGRWSNTVGRQLGQTADSATTAVQNLGEDVAETTARATENTAETLAAAAFWSFVCMLVGAGSAFAGGWVWTPKRLLSEDLGLRTPRA